jgi:hypothetical protein
MDGFKKIPIEPTRHSRSLVETIKAVQQGHPEAREVVEKGQWVIRDGNVVLGGPSPTQWGAWMEASYGTSRTE